LHPEELRESFRVFPARFLPLVLTPLVFVAITLVTADPEPGTGIVVEQFFAGGVRMLATNLCAFFAHWSLAVPLVIPWLILRWRKLPWKLIALTLPVFGAASIWLGWIVYLVAASVAVFADILMESLRNRDRIQLGLWVWLLPALATIAYVHLPCKYLLPSVAAAVILVVRLLPASEARVGRWLIPAAVAAGAIVGLLILSGTRTLAEAQRSAVAELITPRLQQGEHVLFAGQWGFHWYAEEAGAEAASWLPPNVQPGDIVVISLADQPLFPQKWTRRRLIEERSFSKPGIRVMDRASGAGFFSCPWGYLPVTWSSDQTNQFEVWQIE